MSKKGTEKQDSFENVESALTSTELFLAKYRKPILYGVGGIVLAVLLVLAVRSFYIRPREIAAENEIYRAQLHFERDSFRLALEGDGDVLGFKEIASEYGFTQSGGLATAYAGICYYKLGDYQNAIKYLSQFDGKDQYLSAAVIGLIGDSYADLGETTKAISYFEKAADYKNDVISPVYLKKAGIAYESVQNRDKAFANYQSIKDNYPRSFEASDIDKYIARVQK